MLSVKRAPRLTVKDEVKLQLRDISGMKINKATPPIQESLKTSSSLLRKSASCPSLLPSRFHQEFPCRCISLRRSHSAVVPNQRHVHEYPTSNPNIKVPSCFRFYKMPLSKDVPPVWLPSTADKGAGQMMEQLCSTAAASCPAPPCCKCGCGCCGCLPPPCNTPPKCMQFMTGYYYYPYGFWFCGPYHVTGTMCPGGPVSPGGPCGPCPPNPGGPCGPCGPGCVCGVYDIGFGKSTDPTNKLDLSKIFDAYSKLCCFPVSLNPGPSKTKTSPIRQALSLDFPRRRYGVSCACGCCGPCGGCGPCGPSGPAGPFGPCGPGYPGMSCNFCGGCCASCPCGPCGCGPCGCGPCKCGPCGPCAPCPPCAPCCGPCGPCAPCCGPCGPCCGPCAPCCGPCAPCCGPCGPCGPCCCPACVSCRPFCGCCMVPPGASNQHSMMNSMSSMPAMSAMQAMPAMASMPAMPAMPMPSAMGMPLPCIPWPPCSPMPEPCPPPAPTSCKDAKDVCFCSVCRDRRAGKSRKKCAPPMPADTPTHCRVGTHPRLIRRYPYDMTKPGDGSPKLNGRQMPSVSLLLTAYFSTLSSLSSMFFAPPRNTTQEEPPDISHGPKKSSKHFCAVHDRHFCDDCILCNPSETEAFRKFVSKDDADWAASIDKGSVPLKTLCPDMIGKGLGQDQDRQLAESVANMLNNACPKSQEA